MKRFKVQLLKIFAVVTALSIINQIVFPTVAMALTSGPQSPEFLNFTPVSTTNMVDLATGDFNYNLPVVEIPGTDGSGYALSLAYNSGINSEQEASWVGLGWNINPGAINRNTRGFPDDFSGESMKIYNKTKPNWSVTSAKNIGAEIFTVELGVSRSVRFNNHNGFFASTGLSAGICGVGLNLNLDPNGKTFSANVNPIKTISSKYKIAGDAQILKANRSGDPVAKSAALSKAQSNYKKYSNFNKKGSSITLAGGNFGLFTYSDATRATTYKKFEGLNISFTTSINVNPAPVPIGLNGGAQGNINLQVADYDAEAHTYGYFNSSENDDKAISDYYVEKASDYNRRDIFIGIPFGNADIFGVTGEGLNGGFRGYKGSLENYRYATPGGNTSEVGSGNLGLDFSVGTNFGVGLGIGVGYQKNKMDDWGANYSIGNDDVVFRFNNDLGGKIIYDNNEIEKAELSYVSQVPGSVSVKLGDALFTGVSLKKAEAGSSTFIDYHTYQQIGNLASNTFTKKLLFSEQNIPVGSSSILEYSIYNENGENYVYGVPVFTRNETNLSFDIDKDNSTHTIVNNYLAFRKTPLSQNSSKYEVSNVAIESDENKTVLGEIRNSPYVSSYLLSQITQPNYVDINDNGPDEADYGGWTKFSYRKVYGKLSDETDNWYRYRTPYGGLHYSQNSISDTKDDMGSITTGEKEIYYLEVVETKTHIAFFVTNKYINKNPRYNVGNGSGASRYDGMGSVEPSETEDLAANETNVEGLKKDDLEYLERIVLYSKAQPNKPIKTVYLSYDYSLVPNLPNNANSNYSYLNNTELTGQNSGKLTLRKVWFEYEGTSPAKISPYVFSYSYKRSADVNTGNEYFSDFDNLSADLGGSQNPIYAPELLDPWGNIMPYGKERQKYDIPWRYQGRNSTYASRSNNWRGKIEEDDNFDPAAWHLKSIKLPSGGEIHIQYEEKDYGYVQDQPAMAMASLVNNDNSFSGQWFDINVDDLGCVPDDLQQVTGLKKKIDDYFSQSPGTPGAYADKVYFKFLYDLLSSNAAKEPDLDNPNAEYITGYSAFESAEIVDGPTSGTYAIRIHLEKGDKSPRRAAYDFVVNQRQGLLSDRNRFGPFDYNETFGGTIEGMAKGLIYNNVATKDILKIILAIGKLYIGNSELIIFNYGKENVCNAMSNSLSFLKLPMYKAKKGGGVRVKRLLMYDSGLENGDAKVLGQQYHYILDDGVSSSGVATNEPSAAREENPLVKYMVRKKQSSFSRLTSGEDKEQTEGPIGESLLPMAAVYHSRVVVENIHSDKTNTGFIVNEFYTTKDYPFDGYYGEAPESDIKGFGVEFTNLSNSTKTDVLPAIAMPFFSYSVNKAWMAQGFRFIQNSMNGLLKQKTVYGGKYNPAPGVNKDYDNGYTVSVIQNQYYEPGERIRVLKPNANGGYDESLDNPGKETEMAIEGKQLSEDVFGLDISFDLTIGIAGVIPIPFFMLLPNIGISNELIATHATTKVIRYPAILKSVTIMQDGMISRTEYQAFNAFTGQPVIVKTFDGYAKLGLEQNNGTRTGEIYQFTMPANWKYSEMGPKSVSVSNANQLSAQTINITSYGLEPSSSWFDGSAATIANIIGVNVSTYQKNWESSWTDPKIKTEYNITDVVQPKLNNTWRSKASYIYKDDQYITASDKLAYEKGYYTISDMFDWNTTADQPNWIKVSEVKKYSPDGSPLEEVDVMNIPSAVIYGPQYMNSLPVMIAQNAEHSDIYFNDFEGAVNNSPIAHSGLKAMLYAANASIINNVYTGKQLKKKGGLLKIWVAYVNPSDVQDNLSATFGHHTIVLEKAATSGTWSLYEGKIDGNALPENIQYNISIGGYTGTSSAYIDDARFQPVNAQASCYVYDQRSYKLLTQFDDRHFGTYYQYNQEGALTHKILETERGLKTVQESQYNTPKTNR